MGVYELIYEYKNCLLICLGDKKAKTQEALLTIGPAVFNGGLTTFLALVLLGFSTSHVFISFFKVNKAKTGSYISGKTV